MKRSVLPMLLVVLAVGQLGHAQQANQNINVLPVYYNDGENVPPYLDEDNVLQSPLAPDAYLKGDLFLQRQVEPTIAVSTRNPDHMIAFFNDYRAVDIPEDLGVGEGGASVSNSSSSLLARVLDFFRGRKSEEINLPEQATLFPEAWVGGSRSLDGGLTWSGFWVPGGPFDNSTASLESAVYGLEAGTDPVAAAGPCGTVYLSWLAFTRGGTSMMVLTRYQDSNGLAGGDTWLYQGSTVMEIGNNADNGYFLDKPFVMVDPVREAGAGCDHNIYASYTTFNGLAKDGKFQSKVTFARTTGDEFGFVHNIDVLKLNAPYQQSQGTWIIVDPQPGTPNTTGGGTVHLFWRHFFDPNAILTIKSTNYGATFPGNPKKVTGNWDLETYDQLGISTTAATGAVPPLDPNRVLSFRSNAFPTAAICGNGTIYLAWQERVDAFCTPDSADLESCIPGEPLAKEFGGTPRIVMMKREVDSAEWTDLDGNPGFRRAVDFGFRDSTLNPKAVVPEPGFGALPQVRYSGPQVMPSLSCGGDRLMLTYLESRGYLVENELNGKQNIALSDLTPISGFISGIDRVMDLRAALIDPVTGELLSTTQVSRYPIAPEAVTTDGETVEDIAPVIWPCSPDSGNGLEDLEDCDRGLNLVNKPQSAAGTTSFIGDYNFLVPIVSMVADEGQDDGDWRWAIAADDLPYRSFHAVWADNRNLIPPTQPDDPDLEEWERYPFYSSIPLTADGELDFQFDSETGKITNCPLNWGAKNTDVLTARVEAELILSLPTNSKQICDNVSCDFPRSFPLTLTNGVDELRYFRIAFTDPEGGLPDLVAGLSFSQVPAEADFDYGYVALAPFSSATIVAWVAPGIMDPVPIYVRQVDVDEDVIEGGQSGVVTINADSSNDPLQNYQIDTVEFHDVLISNPLSSNPLSSNPLSSNPMSSNPLSSNPMSSNPLSSNSTLTDTVTWTVTQSPSSNVSSPYALEINIDEPEKYQQAGFTWGVVAYKESFHPGLDADTCMPLQVPQAQVLSAVFTGENDISLISNPLSSNPLSSNPMSSNPLSSNPLSSNLALTVAPADGGTSPGAPLQQSSQAPIPPTEPPGYTTKAPLPPQQWKVTLLAFCGDEVTTCPDIFKPEIDPPSLAARPLACDEPFLSVEESCRGVSPAPDLVLLNPDTLTAVPATVGAGETVVFPVPPGCDPGVETCEFTVENDSEGIATPENEPLTHGVYLSDSPSLFRPDGTFDNTVMLVELSDPVTQLPAQVTQLPQFVPANEGDEPGPSDSFLPEAQAKFPSFSVQIPLGTVPGTYYLHVWVDDGQEISEFNEPNNAAGVAITVEDLIAPPGGITFDAVVDAVEGSPVTFTVTFSDPNDTEPPTGSYTYVWNFGDVTEEVTTNEPTVVYTYNDNGSFIASVTITDSDNQSGDGTLSFDVANVKPIADDDAYSTAEEALLTIAKPGVLGNDDEPVDTLTAVLVSGPSNGSLTLNADGSFTYTPEPDANGPVTFTYVANDGTEDSNVATVTITVDAVNDAPVAGNDSYSTDEDVALTIDATGVLGNDSDIDSDPLTAVLVSGPSNGSLTLNADGSFTYTPEPDANGPVTFTYKANDGTEDSNTATVTIAVDPVNDAPVAFSVTAVTDEDSGDVVWGFSAADIDSSTLTYGIVTGPAKGTVKLGPGAGQFTYTPDPDYSGSDSFTYKANDGSLDSNVATAMITINSVNDPPEAVDDAYVLTAGADLVVNAECDPPQDPPVFGVLCNDSDPVEGDSLTAVLDVGPANGSVILNPDGSFTYTPDAGYYGSDSFTYVADDGRDEYNLSNVATVTIALPYLHIGLLDPWKPPFPAYAIKQGSALPVRWQFADRATGEVIDSGDFLPEVRLRSQVNCQTGLETNGLETILTPGNSTYQYDDKRLIHQLNVDTNELTVNECYNIYTYVKYSTAGPEGQLDGPFIFKLKKKK